MESLIKRKIFTNEEQAGRELLRDYVLRQIASLQRDLARFECKYGMSFERFSEYLHERSVLLETQQLSPQQRQSLGQAIMLEEDDWFDWKASLEMLDSWLGLRQEAAV